MLLLVLAGLLVVGGGAAVMLSGGDDGSGPGGAGPTTPAGDPGELELDDATDPEAPAGGEDAAGGEGSATIGAASPEAAVQGYIKAVVDADCEAVVAHFTENMLSGMDRAMAVDECESTAENQPDMARLLAGLDLGATDEEAGVARIEGHADFEGSPLIIVFTVVQDGDAWLIDNVE